MQDFGQMVPPANSYAPWSGRESAELSKPLHLTDESGAPIAKQDGLVQDGSGESPEPAKRVPNILVVDDEPLIADTLKLILNRNGFNAQAVYGGDAAIAALPMVCPDIVLTDVSMPGRNGIETGILIRQSCPNTRVVLFSGQAGVTELIEEARRQGYGFDLWPKPIHPRDLVRRLREL